MSKRFLLSALLVLLARLRGRVWLTLVVHSRWFGVEVVVVTSSEVRGDARDSEYWDEGGEDD